ncbi:MAG: helix-hairpin-helix domain-containing protein [Bacteroidales bacterium]|jgi:DNA uptake protein ComE-like DNA-binding protein|nr:helix-hairpin-helix domain-containing protein [Bacteroidales bacterium]
MKKLFTSFTNFFGFSKSERRGIVALLSILVVLMMGIQMMPYYSKSHNLSITDEISESHRSNIDNDTSVGAQNLAPLHSPQLSQHSSQQNPQRSFQPVRGKKPFTVQANTCDTLDLQQIRGIGSTISKRIIRYREQLGGFVRKEQLLEVWGIDSARYAQIEAAFIIDKKNIRKLNINTATIRELQNHPYLDYYQAKAIVQTRDKQGLYETITDILKLALIDRETFDLIKDYLEL